MANGEEQARRVLGERLSLLRRAAGFSQHAFAPMTLYCRSTIANVEVGRQNVPRSFWQRCDELLDAAGTLVLAFDELERARQDRLRQASVDGAPVWQADDGHASESVALLRISRREKVALGQQIGRDFVVRLRLRTARLRRLDDILGGGDTFGTYQAEYESTRSILEQSRFSETVRKCLLSVLAEQAQQAGWAAFDAGKQAVALQLYRASMRAADEAGDLALHGNAYAFLAYQRLNHDPASALALADASCEMATSALTGSVGALMHERRAWAYAVAGDVSATQHALDRAQVVLDATTGEPEPDWSRWVNAIELQIMSGRCWAVLGRPLRAVPLLRTALARVDDTFARDKALYMSWQADSYLMAGEIEESARIVDRALDLSAGVSSVRPRQQLAGILTRLAERSELPVVRQVLEKAKA